jgi:hypothetical protein
MAIREYARELTFPRPRSRFLPGDAKAGEVRVGEVALRQARAAPPRFAPDQVRSRLRKS